MAKLVLRQRALLGEGARWCSRTHVLFWVDILGMSLHELDPVTGRTRRWQLPKRIGCSAALADGCRLLALEDGLYRLNLETGLSEVIQTITHPSNNHRFNDGAVDPLGRFWVGSMNESGVSDGQLFCFDDPVRAPRIFGDNWGCLNGIGWSPSGETMYVTDSRSRCIWSYSYNLPSGTPTDRQLFAQFMEAVPDGLCVDASGSVWVALWDGHSVVRLDVNGRILQRVRLPVRRPTSVALGGRTGRTLFITSASVNVPATGDPRRALDGSIFMANVDIPGAAELCVQARPAVSV